MSINPLNELKRRLSSDGIPLSKRLCLAKNVIISHNFPSAPKEKIVSEWLDGLLLKKQLSRKDFLYIMSWLDLIDVEYCELKSKFIHIVYEHVKANPIENDASVILSFIISDKIFNQLSQHITEYLFIIVKLLQTFNTSELADKQSFVCKIFNNIIKYFKESKKKLEFIMKFVEGETLETIFSYLNTTCHDKAIETCKSIMFPVNKKSYFISYLQNLVRNDNIDHMLAEKTDSIQSTLKIMSILFSFPKSRTSSEPKFITDFIDVFVTSYKNDYQLIFAFYIMATSVLDMPQSYLIPTMKMEKIGFDDKVKRNLFLSMLEILLKNEVDINIRLTDTFGAKISKVEIKKTFASFLQVVMLGQLKLVGKVDKTTLCIVKTALKLDPSLVEQKIDVILPPLMTAKKNSNVTEEYETMLNCLLEIFFKLSRGILFLNQMIPQMKLYLEKSNPEQSDLRLKIKETSNNTDCVKLKTKLITGNDVFPEKSIYYYGKLTADLMFRQNTELLTLLQKSLEDYCLNLLKTENISPSALTLTEVLSAILSSFLHFNKMADHTVPLNIAEDFWAAFANFEKNCLKQFGECIAQHDYDSHLVVAFLKICRSFLNLKILNVKYSNVKLNIETEMINTDVTDLSAVLPCLNKKQWKNLINASEYDDAVNILNDIFLAKIIMVQLIKESNEEETLEVISNTKSLILKNISNQTQNIETSKTYMPLLLSNLPDVQLKQVSKQLVTLYLNDFNSDVFLSESVINNKSLLNTIVLDISKKLMKLFDNAGNLTKLLSKNTFDIKEFSKTIEIKTYFNQLVLNDSPDSETIINYLDILKLLNISQLEENYQLIVIFVLLVLKKNCPKKIRRNIDSVLVNIFELSPKNPDIYKIFSLEMLFGFNENNLIEIMTLNSKSAYPFYVIKCALETAVKKVKSDSDIIKNLVDMLLAEQKKNKTNSVQVFGNVAFQISHILLPLIAKEKKILTTSAYRSILANLQEKLHKAILKTFKNIDFSSDLNVSIKTKQNKETDESFIVSENVVATFNAMEAYSLTVAKYCESTDVEESKNLNFLWSALEYFINIAINSIKCSESKTQQIDASLQLLNVILRYIKKLETHEIFKEKNKILSDIFNSLISRLTFIHDDETKLKNKSSTMHHLEEIGFCLKFLCEISPVDNFINNFVSKISGLMNIKNPSDILKDDTSKNKELTSHKVAKYLWQQILKAHIVGPKCAALAKIMMKNSKTLRSWIQQNYELQNGADTGYKQNGVVSKKVVKKQFVQMNDEDFTNVKIVTVEDEICKIVKYNLDELSEIILAAKKISLDYKFLDTIFELQHSVHCILNCNATDYRFDTSWQAFFELFESCLSILNSLIVSREELLEDRWPCFMQCYRSLIICLCQRSTSDKLDRPIEDKFSEIAHNVEKLTQSMCKRKAHISRLAAYSVADICSLLERSAPSRIVRQHLENSIALLIQASDSTYAMAFLRRSLAGIPGQMTMTNMYTMYKRYHKYVGNA